MIKKVPNSIFSVIIGFLILLLISSCQKPASTDMEKNVNANNKNVTQTVPETHADCQTTPQPISIASPAAGRHVCMRTMVSGCVSDATLQVFVLIHPMATNKFWVQPIPNMGADGSWEAYCYFGEQTQGVGEPFEIIAVASRHRNLFREGDTLLSPLQDNPQILFRSITVKVTRDLCLQ